MKYVEITAYEAEQRLDRFLGKYFNKAPAGFVYKMLRKKRIKLNGTRAAGNELLKPGDRLTFYIAPETMDKFMSARMFYSESSDIPSKNKHTLYSADDCSEIKIFETFSLENFCREYIVYEDANILAVNKPRGMLTHGHNSLIDISLEYLHHKGVFTPSKTSVFTPAFCNRIDRNTSGIVVCGKTPAALRELNRAISERCIDKYYLTVVKGTTGLEREIVSGYHKNTSANRAFASGGKEMITHFKRIAASGGYSLLMVRLITGRSHQIRTQMSAIGHPIAGDYKYGGAARDVNMQLLHAGKIIFGGMSGDLSYLNGLQLYAPPDKWFIEHAGALLGLPWPVDEPFPVRGCVY